MKTRTLLAILFIAATALFTSACGDSVNSSADSTPKNEGLRDAYFRVTKDMTVDQVKAAIGGTPWYAPVLNGQVYSLSYYGVDIYEGLSVTFSNNQAKLKTYTRVSSGLLVDSLGDSFP
jgi:hypothetical protein